MKQILASLIAAYTLTNGLTTVAPGTPAATPLATAGAIPVIPIANPIAPAAPVTTTAGTTTASGGSLPATGGVSPPIAPPAVFPQPTPGSATTTTTPPIGTPGATLPVVAPPQPPIGTPGVGVVSPPVNPVPVAPAPVTPAPVTPAPTTAAPTTAAPTMNQYCPLPAELGNTHGVTSGTAMSSNQGCISPHERAVAFNGILQCNSYACCQCAEIQCGDPMGLACDELVISDSGAVGNQNINVLGDMMSAFGGGSFAGIGGGMNNGAQIRCNGMEACKASKIYGKYVGALDCAGDMGCAGANIRLEDPGNELQVQCNGMMTCMNTNLEIVITPQSQIFELGTIEFNGQQSAQGMTITIENQGYNPILLQNLECMNPTACPNLRINIIGNIMIENCDLQHMNIQTAGPTLLAACQAGNNFNQGFGFGVAQFPQVPQQPLPQQPLPPIGQPQPLPPVTQPQPVPPVTQPQPVPPVTQPQPPAVPAPPVTGVQPVPPVTPVTQPQPPATGGQQAPAYNPMNNPYCNPMSGMYDAQDCYQTSFMYNQQGGAPGVNTNNPYCNPMSGMYDIQDCIRYGGMLNAGGQGQAGPGLNSNNPYCNPMSGMYDIQDCMLYGGMFQQQQQPAAPAPNTGAQYPQYPQYPQFGFPQYPQYPPFFI